MIESLPDADGLIVIWFKLLCLAGKQNNSGVFVMNGRMPYTDEMFATIFRRNISTVRLALSTFESFGMIERINDAVTIPNWGKHQSLDQIEKRKEYQREYMRERRSQQKAIAETSEACKPNSKPNSYTNGQPNVRPLDKIREDKNRLDKIREYEGETPSPPPPTPKKTRHKYGDYEKVLLDDEQLEKLQSEFPDWKERIQRLDDYIASTGKVYKNHLATIRNWAKRDGEQKTKEQPATNNPFLQRKLERMAAEKINEQRRD